MVELETLAVYYACNKASYYLQCAPRIDLFSDKKVVCDLVAMNLTDIKNKRLQLIFEKLRAYSIVPHHVKGETNYLPHRLSRNPSDIRD